MVLEKVKDFKALNRMKTDNTRAKQREEDKGQIIIYKALYRKLTTKD